MPYAPKTAAELRALLLRTLAAYLPDVPTAPGRFAYLEAAAIARLVADLHVRQDEQDRNATPLTASEAGLAVWAELLEVPRNSATGSARAQALRVNGAVGAVIPASTTLTHRTGLSFEVTTAVTMPGSGTALANVRALSTGEQTNLAAGEGLVFDAAPVDISPGARLELDLADGTDEEPIGQWRARVVARFRQAIQGGTRSDFTQWIQEAIAGVTAYVYPNKPSAGSVSLAALRIGSGATRAMTTAERATIATYIGTKRPITDNIVVLETAAETLHIELRLDVLASAAFDWDDSPGYTVVSYTASTGELELSPGVPPDLSPGHLLTVAKLTPGSSGADGFPSEVSAIVDGTTIVLAPFGGRSLPLSWQPVIGDPVYAYSRTAHAVRTAVLSGYSVGCGADAVPQPGIDTLGPANPGQSYGDWIADLRRDRLAAAARSVAGVIDCTVVAPALDTSPTEYAFPDDDTVGFLVPGQVLVRSA